MPQIHHKNAKTNLHFRKQICNSSVKNDVLAKQFSVSKNTISKWKKRKGEDLNDHSSRPKNIHYALSPQVMAIACTIRKTFWSSVDQIQDELQKTTSDKFSRSSFSRLFVRENINQKPKEIREKAKKFKEYEPGFLHIDVTYLPKFGGQKYYLFVAIDRATRLLLFEVYEEKSAKNAENFLQKCKDFFPFKIEKILTDNGLEFTNRLIKSKKGDLCKKDSLFDLECKKDTENPIIHRLTAPHTPKTNGMVERANGIIKNNTILKYDYENAHEMRISLAKFMLFYNFERRHGSLQKEINARTPFDALKFWYEKNNAKFFKNPAQFKNYLLSLHSEIIQV